MSESTVRTFRCDSPGCKSYCEAPQAVVDEAPNLENYLTSRGWRVAGDRHLCPGHKDAAPSQENVGGKKG